MFVALYFAAVLALPASAAIILNERFNNYANGPLITVSGGIWVAHSSTTGQVDVANGRVNLTASESEDVNTTLAGKPYTNGYLYFSVVINMSSTFLPTAAGSYFIHLKDEGTLNFRAKVFTGTTNAAPGMYRVGIANGLNSPVWVNTDLVPNTDYTLVIRYDCATASNTTLWVNPVSEDSTVDQAVATDSTTPIQIVSIALRQANGIGTLTVDDIKVGTSFSDVVGGGANLNPPSISTIPNQSIPANNPTPAIPFVVFDEETPAENLVVSAVSSNQAVLPDANIVLGGSGQNRTVTLTPAPNAQGSAYVTIFVQDGDGNTASRTFLLVVGAPAISAIPDQVTYINVPVGPVAFTISDSETGPESLSLSVFSSNQSLIPDGNIALNRNGGNCSLQLTPTANLTGSSTIQVIATDGITWVTNRFTVTVAPRLGLLLADEFSYTDGPLVANSINANGTNFWFHTSGAVTNEIQVVGGRVMLDYIYTEDVAAGLTNAPYYSSNGVVLYAAFNVEFTYAPITNYDYFAHFKDASSNFRGKIFSTTNGAAPGMLRLGIANSQNQPSAIFPMDLAYNSNYTVVIQYVLPTAKTRLWINPTSENDTSVTATDSASTINVHQFALRESTGIPQLYLDNLLVGSAFTDVVPSAAPVRLSCRQEGNNFIISWPASATGYSLYRTQSLRPVNWQLVEIAPTVIGPDNVITLPMSYSVEFFELKK